MKFEVGKKYVVKLGKKHRNSIIEAKYIEYREEEDSHVVQTVKVIEWNASPIWLEMAKKGLQFIVGTEQILKEVE